MMKLTLAGWNDYRRWLVGGFPVLIYLTVNLALSAIPVNLPVLSYVIPAVLWGILGLIVLRLPPYRSLAKYRARSEISQAALLTGFCQVMLYVTGGFFSGFGKSPSSFTEFGILTNIIYTGGLLFGMEASRAWLVSQFGKKHVSLGITVLSVFYTLLSIPLAQVIGFQPEIKSLNTVGSNWLPLLAENLLATMLAGQAGHKPAIIYRGILAAFWWFCPILPDLQWGLKALIGTTAPIAGMLIVNQLSVNQSGRGKARKISREDGFPLGWIVTAVTCMLFTWFAVGLFPIKPSVIPTGSMVPAFSPGDIVLVAGVTPSSIKIGDIIEFRSQSKINIVHRVVEIEGENGVKYFVTKGDANDARDTDPVIPENVVGKVIMVIPKIGWVSIAIKSFFTGA